MHFKQQSFGEIKKFLCNRLSSSLDLTHAFQNSLLFHKVQDKITITRFHIAQKLHPVQL